jgi:hypothetical protein
MANSPTTAATAVTLIVLLHLFYFLVHILVIALLLQLHGMADLLFICRNLASENWRHFILNFRNLPLSFFVKRSSLHCWIIAPASLSSRNGFKQLCCQIHKQIMMILNI